MSSKLNNHVKIDIHCNLVNVHRLLIPDVQFARNYMEPNVMEIDH